MLPPNPLPAIIPLPFLSCPSLHLPCMSQPGPSRGIGIPALLQAALGSAAETHTYTDTRTNAPARITIVSRVAPLPDTKFFILPSCFPSLFSCPRTRLTGTGLYVNFLLIVNFEWYKLFLAFKAPKFKAIIGILNLLGSLFSNENGIIRANPQFSASYF